MCLTLKIQNREVYPNVEVLEFYEEDSFHGTTDWTYCESSNKVITSYDFIPSMPAWHPLRYWNET